MHAVLVEKILRAQPNVSKLYLLVRAADAESAALRFQNEVLLFMIQPSHKSNTHVYIEIVSAVCLMRATFNYRC